MWTDRDLQRAREAEEGAKEVPEPSEDRATFWAKLLEDRFLSFF